MSRYTIGDHSKSDTQQNQIYGGALAFSSAPRLFTIYASGVKTRGITFPSPFNSTVLSDLQNLNKMLHWYRLSDLQD